MKRSINGMAYKTQKRFEKLPHRVRKNSEDSLLGERDTVSEAGNPVPLKPLTLKQEKKDEDV